MTTIDNEELPAGVGAVGLEHVRGQGSGHSSAAGAPAVRGGTGLPVALLAVDALAAVGALALVLPGGAAVALRAACGLLPALVLMYSSGGQYRLRLAPSVLDELPGLAGRATIALAFALTFERCLQTVLLPFALPTTIPADVRVLILLLLAHLTLDSLGRALVYRAIRSRRRRAPRPTLIAGAGHVGQRIAAALLEHPEYGLRPIGFVDADPIFLPADFPVPVLGGPDVLVREVPRRGIRDVILTGGGADEDRAPQMLRISTDFGCDVWFVPSFPDYGAFEHAGRRTAVGDHLWGFPCLRLGSNPMQRPSWAVKRAFDACFAGLGLLLLSPVLLVCALGVRLEGGPGVIFRQERIGLDGRPFTVLKFRTLRPVDEHESATRWNIAHDHRLGPVGRFLRRASLDELPQLWNVLRGEMSLVGPRPERPYFVMRFAQAYPRYRERHRVPVGLTGFAQVNGLRGDTSIEDRARFDNYYIDSWSLWQDVKILLRTVLAVLRTDGS
ncbi:sugar transferase [Streptacidiphilus jiangxiensis]|uniref:Exopolysaccharide biosynthesis polyprenyl glycosylphosphotransferase n=1 Tax=Streptacidiphilus jiangxiensis TaxID=235985 RepID=A0A1H7VR12_STRJI|nr:sugar transferase [Streptacidiphilus jiangxiensis]SEM11600.1 exopolysaccharide biosynthesis polyprenyl glycosylphosphotransferase [Streptacidiphilus jiangxiensis]